MTEAPKHKPRIVVAMDFADELIDALRLVAPDHRVERHYPEVPPNVWGDTEILYTLRAFPPVGQAPNLRWVQLHFAGMEHALTQPFIAQTPDLLLTSASGIHATPIAEYCIGMMIAVNLQLPHMLRQQAKAEWLKDRHRIYAPQTLRGQTLGIVGYGSIGRELARIAAQMGMKVLASKRNLRRLEDDGYTEPGTGDPTGEIPDRMYPAEAIQALARESDFLVIAAPMTSDTRHLINADVLDAMKPTATLLNIARGGLIDEKALAAALAAKKIRAAVLDVFEEEPLPKSSPLWALENVIISPHVAGNNTQYNERAAALFSENIRRYREGRPLLNQVNREWGY